MEIKSMKRLILITTMLAVFLFLPQKVTAEKVAGGSASMAYNIADNDESVDIFIKKMTIKRVLEKYNSPMVESVDDFVNTAVTYDLDFYLLPSIAGLESFFGRYTYPESNNAFGWGRGLIMFGDWSEGIETVGRGLRENYINKGADTVERIGVIYCEGNTWAGKVNSLIGQFIEEEEKIRLFLSQNAVKL
jgi:hypothetical protein